MIETLKDAIARANELYEEDGVHRTVMYRWAKDPIKPRFGEWKGKWAFSIRKGNTIIAEGKEKRLDGRFRTCYNTARPKVIKKLKKQYNRWGDPY